MVTLPGTARASALAEDGDFFYVGLHGHPHPELQGIDASDPNAPYIAWSLEIGSRVNDILVRGGYAYLATRKNDSELVVVDLARRSVVARFDAPTSHNGAHLKTLVWYPTFETRNPGGGPRLRIPALTTVRPNSPMRWPRTARLRKKHWRPTRFCSIKLRPRVSPHS